MGHLRAYHAAAGGKHPASKASRTGGALAATRSLIFAVATLSLATLSGSASYAQSGPFAGMAGNWAGGGTVTLDDGSTERIRCRASYAVGAGGNGLNLSLVCASDSYKFDLRGNVIAERGALSGTWSESSRGISREVEPFRTLAARCCSWAIRLRARVGGSCWMARSRFACMAATFPWPPPS